MELWEPFKFTLLETERKTLGRVDCLTRVCLAWFDLALQQPVGLYSFKMRYFLVTRKIIMQFDPYKAYYYSGTKCQIQCLNIQLWLY